jgi:hypothetical protein
MVLQRCAGVFTRTVMWCTVASMMAINRPIAEVPSSLEPQASRSVPLVHLRLRRGEAIAEPREVAGTGVLYFCGKDWCPHYQGQLGLLAGAEAMLCALVQHPPDRICQPFYLEVAEHLDRNYRRTWDQRLAEAEAFEAAVATAATAAGAAQ